MTNSFLEQTPANSFLPALVTVLEHVSHNSFERDACVAWLSDVQVVRGEAYWSSK